MKKIIVIILFLAFMSNTEAKEILNSIKNNGEYTNYYGVTINESNYNKIKNILSEEEIKYLPEEAYQEIKNNKEVLAAKSLILESKYVKVAGTNFLLEEKILPIDDSNIKTQNTIIADKIYETTSKRIYMQISTTSSGKKSFYMYNRWLKLPTHRSFDVFAMRWSNANNISIYDYDGTQDYKLSNTSYTIDYDNTSNNFQIFGNNGISLSQNLVDDSTYYMQTVKAIVNCSGATTLYGTYQHAQGTVTLAQSKMFTLGANGMGGVIVWGTSNLSNIYDNTKGLQLSFTC